jgi:predicted metal-dependent phosphoesterase TrpH
MAVAGCVVMVMASGAALGQGMYSETSLRFWQMHRPDSPFRDPDWMQQLDGTEPGGRYGARNAMQAYWLLGSSEKQAELEPERLGRELLLTLPLAGRGNLLPLLLEPPGSLAGVLVERAILRRGRSASRIEPPPGFVAIDTHVHTCYSPDSVADPAQVLLAAARRGLAGIAVTDHDTVDGARQAQAVARQLKAHGKLPASFFVIEGEEVGSRAGHIIALFLHETVPADLSAADTIAAIHAQGGLAVAAHPLLPSGVGKQANTLPFDAVETENSAEELHFALASSRANHKRAPFYATVRKPQLGVSDAHDLSAIGMGYTLVPGTTVDEPGLRRALAGGLTQACVMASEQHLRRAAGGIARPVASGLGIFQGAAGWGSHLLKRITRADQARLRPTLGSGGVGCSLSLSKRF